MPETIINYSHYSDYMTTIQISEETKEMISSFGRKGETYEQIIKRMFQLASREHVRRFLMSSEGCIPIEEAIRRLKNES